MRACRCSGAFRERPERPPARPHALCCLTRCLSGCKPPWMRPKTSPQRSRARTPSRFLALRRPSKRAARSRFPRLTASGSSAKERRSGPPAVTARPGIRAAERLAGTGYRSGCPMAAGPARRGLPASRLHLLRPRPARSARLRGQSHRRCPAVTAPTCTLRKFRPQRQLRRRSRPLAHRRQARRLANPLSCVRGPRRHSPPRSHRASQGRRCPGRHRLLLPRRSLSVANCLGERRRPRPRLGRTRRCCRNAPPALNRPSTGHLSPRRRSTGQLRTESMPCHSGRLPVRSRRKTSPVGDRLASGSGQGSGDQDGLASRPSIWSRRLP